MSSGPVGYRDEVPPGGCDIITTFPENYVCTQEEYHSVNVSKRPCSIKKILKPSCKSTEVSPQLQDPIRTGHAYEGIIYLKMLWATVGDHPVLGGGVVM